MMGLLRDIRHAFRILHLAKGWTAVVVLTLAVGIGANVTILTAVNALLLRTLQVRDPDSLVRLRSIGVNDMVTDSSDYGFTESTESGPVRATFSFPMFQHFRAANRTMTDLFATVPVGRLTVRADGRADTISGLMATGNYHDVLGVSAQAGRMLTPADDSPSAPPVAVISDKYWRSRFSTGLSAIGRVVHVNNIAVTIVGVEPAGFNGIQRPNADPRDITMPMSIDRVMSNEPKRLDSATYWWVQVMGRLRPGVTVDQVRGNLESVFQSQARAGMDSYLASLSETERRNAVNASRNDVPRLLAQHGRDGIYDANTNDLRAIAVVGTIAGLVLLLVSANVTNLLLSRAMVRGRELSVRLSMGATRPRLIRQLLTESVVLGTCGGVAGLLVAYWVQPLLPAPIGVAAPLEARVIGFMVALTVAVSVGFGIAPAFRATRAGIGAALKDNSRSVAPANTALSRALMVAQVAISLVLLVGAGLFLRTLQNLQRVDIGYDPNNLVFVRIFPNPTEYDIAYRNRFFQQGIERLESMPGVRAATLSVPTMLSGSVNTTRMFPNNRPATDGPASSADIHRVVVAPNYFSTMGITLVGGRLFSDRDNRDAPKVAIINQAAARKFFRNENPVGLRYGGSVETTGEIEIVGVVRDVKYASLRDAPPPTIYIPYLQRGPDGLIFTVRTAADPASLMPAIRRAISEINPNIPVVTIETQASQIERRFAQEKVLAQAYTIFAGIALFVAAIGLFGLMSYNVSRRTREIGIRMAIGAQRPEVLSLVLRESLVLVFAGVAIGVAVALGAGRLIASQLFGLEPTDLGTILSAIALLFAVAAVAGYVPARRATRVDPMVALRYE